MNRLNIWTQARRALALIATASGLGASVPTTRGLHLEPGVEASITLTPITEHWDGAGFLPVRARVENRADQARGWTLLFNAQRGYSSHTAVYRAPLAAEARGARETVLFVPGGAVEKNQGVSLGVELTGPGAAGSYANLTQTRGEQLILTATHPDLETALFAATNGAPGPRIEISAADPALWPADWRVWSPFQRVVLTEAQFASLDAPRRAALRDWAALGGTLDLYPETGYAEARTERVGLGAVRRQASALAALAGKPAQVDLGERGMGALATMRGAFVSDERRRELMPATGALGLSFFLLGFGVLVGPINLFVFAPAQRRQRLFVTVPLISLAASALMAGYIVVKDGFGGEGTRRGLVWLLPETNQAVVAQTQVARTGVLLGDGFALADDVVLEQVIIEAGPMYVSRNGADAKRYERAPGAAGGDWFTSRSRQEQTLMRLAPTRARVELVAGGAAPAVQSSVGVVLRDFVYLDASGVRWVANEVPPGQRVALRRAEAHEGGAVMRVGSFAAVGGAAEGLTPIETLASIRWDESEFVYAGPVVGARAP